MNYDEQHRYIAANQSNICQIAATKNGRLVYSDTWNGFQASDSVHIASATKSIISLLLGIALQEGLMQNTEQKVFELFQYYRIKRGEKTIQQV